MHPGLGPFFCPHRIETQVRGIQFAQQVCHQGAELVTALDIRQEDRITVADCRPIGTVVVDIIEILGQRRPRLVEHLGEFIGKRLVHIDRNRDLRRIQ